MTLDLNFTFKVTLYAKAGIDKQTSLLLFYFSSQCTNPVIPGLEDENTIESLLILLEKNSAVTMERIHSSFLFCSWRRHMRSKFASR
jgi:hypothetical protein